MNVRTLSGIAIAALMTLTACSDSEPDSDNRSVVQAATAEDGTANIVDTAVGAGTFNTLVTALQSTGLDTVLADETRQFTVFAPTDDAFAVLGTDTINALLEDTETLSDILLYHVIADASVDAATALSLAGTSVTTANGDDVRLTLDGMRLFVNNAEVVTTDIRTSNGIIHVIDAVLSPPSDSTTDIGDEPGTGVSSNLVDTAVAAGNFTILAQALEATDLLSVLADESRSFTVFAPNDDAFNALGSDTINALLANPDTLRDILLYHVLEGVPVDSGTAIGLAGQTVTTANGDDVAVSVNEGVLLINMSRVIAADVEASNGIIHVIDSVLMPPVDQPAPLGNLVDVAVAAGNFNTLVAALQATGLDATLANEADTFTVFAPTDAAFDALGADTVNNLLANPDVLRDILLYHVIGGQAVDSTTAISLAGSSVATANGDTVALSVTDGELFVNMSRVVGADVAANNGIIHVIDTVLLPPVDTVPDSEPNAGAQLPNLLDAAREAGGFSILLAALEATGLDVAIGHGNDLYTVFAPTDAAFQALGQDTIDALLADPATLRNILLYHVIAGTAVDSTTALSIVGNSIEAANGDRFVLRLDGEQLFVNDSRIIATDVRASNGIIHAIDTVLTPPAR